MASGPGGRAEEQPPALPVKQHRSASFRHSSVECDSALLSPVGLQHQNYLCNDVFPEPTDCHAAQCPIHQRYDPSRHQVRFFSDDTPPPVPKKRLARTLSLPGVPPLSPMSPLPRQPQNFDNPLYMLAPIPDNCFQEENSQSLSQLSFDTPDEHLPHLFSSFDDQRLVFQEIQHRHLLSLRGMVQSLDAGILLQGEAAQRDSYQPQDFLLCEGNEPKQIGDAVYFSLHSPKLPGRVLGLRVHRQTDEACSTHTHKHQPPHINMRDVIAHFQGSNTQRNDSAVSQLQDPLYSNKMACTAARLPAGGSAGHATDHMNFSLPSLQYFLMRGHSLSVERDLPHATLEDFVQDGVSLQTADCLDYDRRLCILLLQILMGTQHLYNASSSVAELRPREIFLVWQQSEAETKQGRDASETSGSKEDAQNNRKILMLWKTRGAPRVVLTTLPSAPAMSQPLVYIKSQIIALIQYGLHSQDNPASHASGLTLPQSSYRAGLLYLVSLLQSESIGLQTADMVTMLQVLLWGPRVPLCDHQCPMTSTVRNWLTIKRALLMMQLAERGLVWDQAQSALGWEDCMCLQYLSLTEPETVVSAASKLWITVNVKL